MQVPSHHRLWLLVVASSCLILFISCSPAAAPATSAIQTSTPTPSLGVPRFITYQGHSRIVATESVYALVRSPDGTHVVSGGDDQTAQVWNATTGKTLFTYRGHEGNVTAVVWSPGGKRIISASVDGTVQVWQAP